MPFYIESDETRFKELKNNFEKEKRIYISNTFIDDDNQLIERFFNGDYDIYSVSRAQWWNERFTAEEYPQIKRGLTQRLKVINFKPTGVSGLAFNTKEWPFDDLLVRKAFSHIWNLDKLMDRKRRGKIHGSGDNR